MGKPTLVVMAAGMGSRFGGLKQITPVGPAGQCILEYSVFDAVRAGFGRVVVVIKHAIEETFKEQIGRRLEKVIPVDYVYQELDKLPAGFTVPEGRVKPWGTGHAVLCCRGVVQEPFMVINADDFYGAGSYRLLADFLAGNPSGDVRHIAMVGYELGNTLTEHGYVSRGVCQVDAAGYLTGITERTHIEWREGRPAFTEDGGQSWTPLSAGTIVSMNCWGFPAEVLEDLEGIFIEVLQGETFDPLKSEFHLPYAVNRLVSSGKADVRVLPTTDRWYGMTYAEDRQMVADAIARLVEQGVYPERW